MIQQSFKAQASGVLLSLILLSCTSSAQLSRFPGLEKRVQDYYAAEKAKDWGAAYEFRHKKFKSTVMKDRFLSQMSRDGEGWNLVGYQIKSVSEKGGKVTLDVIFTETPPPNYLSGHIPKGTKVDELEFEDESIWLLEDNIWYAYSPGERGHLSLNSPIAVQ